MCVITEQEMWFYLSDHLVVILLTGLLMLRKVAESYVINAVVEKPKVITCWSCPNKTDSECNKWALKKGCPDNYTVCQTIHQIDVRNGQSILVKKRCALPSECTLDMIGCHDTHIPGIQDCISCCSHANCNEMAPSNLTTALLYSSITNNRAPSPRTIQSFFRLAFLSFWSLLLRTSFL